MNFSVGPYEYCDSEAIMFTAEIITLAREIGMTLSISGVKLTKGHCKKLFLRGILMESRTT